MIFIFEKQRINFGIKMKVIPNICKIIYLQLFTIITDAMISYKLEFFIKTRTLNF